MRCDRSRVHSPRPGIAQAPDPPPLFPRAAGTAGLDGRRWPPGGRPGVTGICRLPPPGGESMRHPVRSDEMPLRHCGGSLVLELGGTDERPAPAGRTVPGRRHLAGRPAGRCARGPCRPRALPRIRLRGLSLPTGGPAGCGPVRPGGHGRPRREATMAARPGQPRRAVAISTCSTRVISTCLAASRLRTSVVITGMSASRSSAARI